MNGLIRRGLTCAVVLGALSVAGPLGTAAAAPQAADCFDRQVPLSVEEQRLDRPAPQELLRRSGYDHFAPLFEKALCFTKIKRLANTVVAAQGELLWRTTVARVQGKIPALGDLSRGDDRPLYWARLQLTKALKQWKPSFALDPAARAALISTLERHSRGQESVDFPAGKGIKRILVSGFDPFTLDRDIRQANPSGATALALDGTVVRTASGPARIEAVVFPVLWGPFAQGTVEQTFLPHLKSGPRKVDLFTTISQGRDGRFDIERFNGAWRGGFGDNDNVSETGVVPIPAGVPTVTPQPQFVPTSLPYQAITAATTGRFPVYDNTAVTEVPAGQTAPVNQPNGPTAGSAARAGGGGNYLSNEVAYRTTLLRDALKANVPGGHTHTPILRFDPANTTQLTDPVFEQNRTDIVDQVRSIVTVAAGTLR